ncbi:hypothetical protein BDV33DRAFT_199696 [Aspergillus novoparasiticus]|uniref:Uncharacterized protein n=1 Tax=Aspergillus novoparasiticus TaxID=986946 RepID=A0A5N6F404_9EURO|nr:hypothetical protein BDV33DRAFT_199696 [Aspergillus novoparasiticus]
MALKSNTLPWETATLMCSAALGSEGRLAARVSAEATEHLEDAFNSSLGVPATIDAAYLKKAFDAAAFFANKAWFESWGTGCRLDFSVYWDPGLDTEVPVMSMASLIVITILLSLHLLILICLTIWASNTERWTGSLDSWAMMRIGGAIADRVPLKIAENTDKMEFLDEIPGWIGDENDANESVGIIGLGAQGALTDNRRYISYEEDHEEKSPS